MPTRALEKGGIIIDMKFSFESQEYRDNLANEIVSLNTKEQRQELLEKKKNTLEYVLAQHIKDFERKTKDGEAIDNDEEGGGEKEVVRKEVEVVLEPMNRELLDGPETRTMELEIIDISDNIPVSVKIIQDIHRLLELEHNVDDPEIVHGWADKIPHKHHLVQHRDFTGSHQNYHILKQYVEMVNAGRSTQLTKEDGTPVDELELHRIADQAQTDFKVFLSEVTEGSFDNPYALYHTIGAYTEGWNGDGGRRSEPSHNTTENIPETLKGRFPHQNTEGGIEEKPIELDNNLRSPELWVHHDTLIYDSMIKPLMIMDASSFRFRHEVRIIAPLSQKGRYVPRPKKTRDLKPFLKVADTKNQYGGQLCFWHDTPWLLIADQIVDPYHGRLIKVKEKKDSIESQYSELAGIGYALAVEINEYKERLGDNISTSFGGLIVSRNYYLENYSYNSLRDPKLAEIIPKLEEEIETIKKYLALLKEFPEFEKKELSRGEGCFPEIFNAHGNNPRECIDAYEVSLRAGKESEINN